MILEKNYHLINMDSVIICERPKLAPHILPMREKMASILGVSIDVVSVKATTHEKIGSLGRQEGIAAQVMVFLGVS